MVAIKYRGFMHPLIWTKARVFIVPFVSPFISYGLCIFHIQNKLQVAHRNLFKLFIQTCTIRIHISHIKYNFRSLSTHGLWFSGWYWSLGLKWNIWYRFCNVHESFSIYLIDQWPNGTADNRSISEINYIFCSTKA